MGRDERDVIVVGRDGGGRLTWLVVGAALGAGLALLFAPKTGKELRGELGKKLRGIRDLADETIEELKIEFGTQDEPELRPPRAGGGPDDAEDSEPTTRPSRPRVVGAREELERRLEAARARRHSTEPEDEEPVA